MDINSTHHCDITNIKHSSLKGTKYCDLFNENFYQVETHLDDFI